MKRSFLIANLLLTIFMTCFSQETEIKKYSFLKTTNRKLMSFIPRLTVGTDASICIIIQRARNQRQSYFTFTVEVGIMAQKRVRAVLVRILKPDLP